MTPLFYSPEVDGRQEKGRKSREERCKTICAACVHRIPCLAKSLQRKEYYGVWGGLTEGERRAFQDHLEELGYDLDDPPTGVFLLAALQSFELREGDASV